MNPIQPSPAFCHLSLLASPPSCHCHSPQREFCTHSQLTQPLVCCLKSSPRPQLCRSVTATAPSPSAAGPILVTPVAPSLVSAGLLLVPAPCGGRVAQLTDQLRRPQDERNTTGSHLAVGAGTAGRDAPATGNTFFISDFDTAVLGKSLNMILG